MEKMSADFYGGDKLMAFGFMNKATQNVFNKCYTRLSAGCYLITYGDFISYSIKTKRYNYRKTASPIVHYLSGMNGTGDFLKDAAKHLDVTTDFVDGFLDFLASSVVPEECIDWNCNIDDYLVGVDDAETLYENLMLEFPHKIIDVPSKLLSIFSS